MARRRIPREHRITVRVQNINRLSPTLVKVGREVDALEAQILRDTSARAIEIFRRYAPGRVADGVELVKKSGNSFEVHAYARSERNNYDFVGVTRLGHKRRIIKPTRRTRPFAGSVIKTRKRRRPGRSKSSMLRVQFNPGDIIFLRQVRGFRPLYDWAELAQEAVVTDAKRRMERAAREIG